MQTPAETNESMQTEEKCGDLRTSADLEETEVEDITVFNDSRRVDPAVFSGLGTQTIKTAHFLSLQIRNFSQTCRIIFTNAA